MRSTVVRLVLGVSLTACGGAGQQPQSARGAEDSPAAAPDDASPGAASAPAKANASEQADPTAVPTDCAKKDELCVPSPAFVKRLCGNVNPDVALAFFRSGTPFSRGYLKMNVERAWNASGGASSADRLEFDEEVIILLVRENKTGITVSGASGSYDVLRWDGTCATLSGEEVTMSVPPKPKNAKIVWKDLSDEMQAALLENESIAKLNKQRRDECKGATMGSVSKLCVKLVDQLSEAVVKHVRDGGNLHAVTKVK
jgi:hypothetical protein